MLVFEDLGNQQTKHQVKTGANANMLIINTYFQKFPVMRQRLL